MKIKLAVIAMAISGLGVAQMEAACACSCAAYVSEAEHFAWADAVFTGVVTQRIEHPDPESGGGSIEWTFDVEGVEKGDVSDPVSIWSSDNDGTCGFHFQLGGRYKVYADEQDDGRLWTGICAGTRSIDEPTPGSPQPSPTVAASQSPAPPSSVPSPPGEASVAPSLATAAAATPSASDQGPALAPTSKEVAVPLPGTLTLGETRAEGRGSNIALYAGLLVAAIALGVIWKRIRSG